MLYQFGYILNRTKETRIVELEAKTVEGALDTELKTYAKHRDLLLGTAEGKFVLIRHEQIVGVYDSQMDAIAQGYQKFGNVPFLVKQIVKLETPLDFRSNVLGV